MSLNAMLGFFGSLFIYYHLFEFMMGIQKVRQPRYF